MKKNTQFRVNSEPGSRRRSPSANILVVTSETYMISIPNNGNTSENLYVLSGIHEKILSGTYFFSIFRWPLSGIGVRVFHKNFVLSTQLRVKYLRRALKNKCSIPDVLLEDVFSRQAVSTVHDIADVQALSKS